jgi:hypothetical protein
MSDRGRTKLIIEDCTADLEHERSGPHGLGEARRIIDHGRVGQRDNRLDAGGGHQAARRGVLADPHPDLPVEFGDLLAQGLPNGQQRFDNRDQHRVLGHQLTHPDSEAAAAGLTNPQAEGLEQIWLAVAWRCEINWARAISRTRTA